MDDRALDADPSAVDQADLAEAALLSCSKVLLDHRRDVAWREGMQVKRILDRNRHRLVFDGARSGAVTSLGRRQSIEGAPALPRCSERWGVWGAMSGPPCP